MTCHQSRNITVLSTGQQIAFPMTRKGSVFHFRRPLADRNRIDDLPAGLSLLAGMTRAAHAPLRPQMVHQLFFQCAPGLNEQATVNRFVGHAQTLVVGILGLQPPGNLLGRPVQDQFTRNEVPQPAVDAKQTLLWPQGRSPSLVIGIVGTIGRTHHGVRPPGTRRRPLGPDLARSPESSNPKRSLGRCPLAPRRGVPLASGEEARGEPLREVTTRRECSCAACQKRAQSHAATGPPSATPNVTLLDRRKPKPYPWSHANTTFTTQIYIRWCCFDLSNAPRYL